MYLCQAQQIIEISDSNVITHEHALLSIESACPRRPFSKNGSFITRPDPDLSRHSCITITLFTISLYFTNWTPSIRKSNQLNYVTSIEGSKSSQNVADFVIKRLVWLHSNKSLPVHEDNSVEQKSLMYFFCSACGLIEQESREHELEYNWKTGEPVLKERRNLQVKQATESKTTQLKMLVWK